MTTMLSSAGRSIVGTYVKEDIETRLKQEVYKKQIRIKEFFFDFDRLRKGWVTEDKVIIVLEGQFRSALSMLNFHLTEQDVNELINRYRLPDGLIKYSDFCQKIDEQFLNSEAKAKVFETPTVYSNEEQQLIDQLLTAVKRKISQKRILLKQPFQDFDRTRCSHITIEQFSRVLTQLSLLPKEEYFQLLVRKYIDNGNPKEVNYVKFCDDVDNVQEMLQGVITGIKQNPKEVQVDEDYVNDQEGIDLMSTLFTSKKLQDKINSREQVEKKI